MKRLLVVLLLIVSAAAAHAEIYTWKDGKGTRFYTNSLHEIPTRYVKKARVLDVATGKIGGLATAQPTTAATAAARPAGSAASPVPQPPTQLTPPQSPSLPAQAMPLPASRDAAPPATVTTQAPAAKVDPDAIYRASERAQRTRGTIKRRPRTEE